MRIKVLFILLLSLLFINTTNANSEKTTVRVGISNQSFSSWDYQNVKLSSDDIVKIISMKDTTNSEPLENIEANKIIEVVLIDNLYNIYIDGELKYEKLTSPLVFSSNSDMQIVELNRKGTPAKYKGMLEIKNSKTPNRFNIINVVDMQNYLRGVVPNEMPVSFGSEALKAQAVAARNYANNAEIDPNYDVVDSTASQVYYGSNSYRDISDQAVAQTKGIYALYNEKPITALYFSTSAGITDDWDDVFSNNMNKGIHPYLKSKIDKQGQKYITTEKEAVDFLTSNNGLDTNSPKFRWSVEFERKELENILHTTLQQQSKAGLVSPKYDGDNKLEGLKEIKVLKRTKSSKVTELLITAKNGEYKVSKELGIRRVLKKNNSMLPSGNFFIETIGQETVETEINEQEDEKDTGILDKIGNLKLFSYINQETYPKTFKITGGGFGHGVGMSQFGAYNMAKIGKKYPQILHYYYTNINLSTFPKTVYFNEWNVHYKTEFYFDKNVYKSAYLLISNPKNVTGFPFKINELEFGDTTSITNNKLMKINITQYLKHGVNLIDFAPLSKENKGKTITYRVELL